MERLHALRDRRAARDRLHMRRQRRTAERVQEARLLAHLEHIPRERRVLGRVQVHVGLHRIGMAGGEARVLDDPVAVQPPSGDRRERPSCVMKQQPIPAEM